MPSPRPFADLFGPADRDNCPTLARAHHLDVLALERDHLRRRVSALRRNNGAAKGNQPKLSLNFPGFALDFVEVRLAHRMLQGLGFQRAAVDYGLALAVLVDALLDGLVGLCRIAELNRAALAPLREMKINFDTVGLGAGLPLRLSACSSR